MEIDTIPKHKQYKNKKKIRKRESYKRKEANTFLANAAKSKANLMENLEIKIAANRLTVETGMFRNSIRSEVAVKEKISNLDDDTNAILNEDLFKLLDLRKASRHSQDFQFENLHPNNFPGNSQHLDEVKQPVVKNQENSIFHFDGNKKPVPKNQGNSVFYSDGIKQSAVKDQEINSIFYNIQGQYEQIMKNNRANENYLVEKTDLQMKIEGRLRTKHTIILDNWSCHFKNMLAVVRAPDYEVVLQRKLRNNQRQINRIDVLEEMASNIPSVIHTDLFVQRKFMRRFNKIASIQDIGLAPILDPEEARAMMNTDVFNHHQHSPEAKPPDVQCTTPEPEIVIVVSPDLCRTPENQRFIYREPNSSSKYRTGLYVRPPNYKSSLYGGGGDSACPRPLLLELEASSDDNCKRRKLSRANSSATHCTRRNLNDTWSASNCDENSDPVPFEPEFLECHPGKIKYTPIEYGLRKKYLPHTIPEEELDDGFNINDKTIDSIMQTATPDVKFRPLLRH